MRAPYAGITRSGSVGRRTRADNRTPPSQPTMWCELPKVSFCKPHASTRARGWDRLLSGGLCRVYAAQSAPYIWSVLEGEPAARPGVEAAVEVDRLATLGIEELGYAS